MAQRKKFLKKTQTKKLLKNYCKNSNKLPYPIITQGKLQRLNKRPGKTSENEQGLASFKHRYPIEKFGIIWKLGLGIWKLRGFIWCYWFFMFKKKLCGSNLVSTNLQWKKNYGISSNKHPQCLFNFEASRCSAYSGATLKRRKVVDAYSKYVELITIFTAWKVSKYGVISGPYFPAFGLNTERSVDREISK